MKRFFALLAAAAVLSSCNLFDPDDPAPKKFGRVMVMYSAGCNNISSYLAGDIEDLASAYVPTRYGDDALVLISHQPASYGKYSTPTSPVMVYLTSDPVDGHVSRDTVYTAEKGALLTDPEVVRDMLSKAVEYFPSDHYSLVFSSHGTGWLPQGYYEKGYSTSYDFWSFGQRNRMEINDFSVLPVKTIGQEKSVRSESIECGIADFADALPVKFDAILLDACLMGGIEVAYEFKEKTDRIVFSQTEILADGLDYGTLAERLLKGSEPDLAGVCEDYFKVYDAKTGISRSATISLVDCTALDELAAACKKIFQDPEEGISKLKPSSVQRYFRYNCHWFYDLEDIVVKSGAGGDDLAAFQEALGKAVLYKAATAEFMKSDNGFVINTHSGLSMYLPCNGDGTLDEYYKTLAWNKASGLVK